MENLIPAPQLNTGIIFVLLAAVIVFYIVKSVLKSVVRGFLYAALAGITIFVSGIVYFVGFENVKNLLRGLFNL